MAQSLINSDCADSCPERPASAVLGSLTKQRPWLLPDLPAAGNHLVEPFAVRMIPAMMISMDGKSARRLSVVELCAGELAQGLMEAKG
jgi:hypothetical protein